MRIFTGLFTFSILFAYALLASNVQAEPLGDSVKSYAMDSNMVHEYRIEGILEEVAITPEDSASYSLIDADGSRVFDNSETDFNPVIHIPEWTLYEW